MISPYAYCNNYPIIFVDPDGEYAQVIAGAALGAIVSGVAAVVDGKTGRELLGSIAGGAIEGAVSSLIPAQALSNISKIARVGFHLATGAVSSAVGSVTKQGVSDGKIEGETLAAGTTNYP